jgi:hypothetical protein
MTGDRPERAGPAKPVGGDDSGATVLASVVDALVRSDDKQAAVEIETIAGQTIASHPLEALEQRADAVWPPGTGVRTRSPSVRVMANIYVRDGFVCAYCARRTVPLAIMRLISLRFPREFPHRPQLEALGGPPPLLGHLHDDRPRPRRFHRRRRVRTTTGQESLTWGVGARSPMSLRDMKRACFPVLSRVARPGLRTGDTTIFSRRARLGAAVLRAQQKRADGPP